MRFHFQEPSVCLHQQEIGPQERDGNSSLGGAPRKHGVRAGVVDILPTGRTRGEGTRLPRRLCFAMHLVASPICQVCRRGLASEDYELHNGRFTELESRWHQQRSLAVVGPAGRPRSASNWSRTRPRQGVHDPLVQARCSRRAPQRHLTGTGVAFLFWSTS